MLKVLCFGMPDLNIENIEIISGETKYLRAVFEKGEEKEMEYVPPILKPW